MQKNHKKTWVTLFMNSSYTRVYKVNIKKKIDCTRDFNFQGNAQSAQ